MELTECIGERFLASGVHVGSNQPSALSIQPITLICEAMPHTTFKGLTADG
jgi:hypothetical protein